MLGIKVGSRVWVQRLNPMAGSQGLVQGMGSQFGSHGYVTRLCLKVGSECFFHWFGSELGDSIDY